MFNKFCITKLKNIDFYYLIIFLLTILGCIFFADKIALPMVDIGREMLFPKEMLNNNVLYKDIFNIFSPFSYLFNAFIYKLFGSGIKTYLILGSISSVILVSGIYQLANLFINKRTAFIVLIVTIFSAVMTKANFSFNHSYTFSMVYGLIFFTYSLFFYIKSIENNNKYFIYLSALLCGFAICTKYEFLLYSIFLVFLLIKRYCKINKIVLLSVLLIISPYLLCLLFLFIHGITFSDLFNTMYSVKCILATNGYHVLYRQLGTLYSNKNLIEVLKYFVYTFFAVFPMYIALTIIKSHKKWAILLMVFSVLHCLRYCMDSSYYNNLNFIAILILVLFVIFYKKLNLQTKIFVFSTIIINMKVFWLVCINAYGAYFIAFSLISLFSMIEDEKIRKALFIFLLISSLGILYNKIIEWNEMSIPVKSKMGTIYTGQYIAPKINKVKSYILKYTNTNDKIVIYPDGLFLNYITERPTDLYYYQLDPAYLEMWGEDNIINYFSNNKPEYFIFTNRNIKEYGKNYMCEDYAQNFCKFVFTNYKKVREYKLFENDKSPYVIYKRI